jgi:hypothetical protein
MGSFPSLGIDRPAGPQLVGPMTLNGGALEVASLGGSSWITDNPNATGVTGTAGIAVFRQFTVDSPTYISSTYHQSGSGGTANSQVEIAIYDEQRQRLATTGTIGSGGLVYVQGTLSVTLQPGCYYLCYHNKTFVGGGTTVTVPFRGCPAMTAQKHRAMGTFEQNVGSGALPATATFATFATNATQGAPYISLSGV